MAIILDTESVDIAPNVTFRIHKKGVIPNLDVDDYYHIANDLVHHCRLITVTIPAPHLSNWQGS